MSEGSTTTSGKIVRIIIAREIIFTNVKIVRILIARDIIFTNVKIVRILIAREIILTSVREQHKTGVSRQYTY